MENNTRIGTMIALLMVALMASSGSVVAEGVASDNSEMTYDNAVVKGHYDLSLRRRPRPSASQVKNIRRRIQILRDMGWIEPSRASRIPAMVALVLLGLLTQLHPALGLVGLVGATRHHEVLACGLGVDSTCLLAMHLERDATCEYLGIDRATLDMHLPDYEAAVFSDPGNEWPHTYANLDYTLDRCEKAGFNFVVVRNEQAGPIADAHIKTGSLPFFNGGAHICSQKWKVMPQQEWAKETYGDDLLAWSIGYAADEEKRFCKYKAKEIDDGENITRMPLMDLGITRVMESAILRHLEWLPNGEEVKLSACVFCPYNTAEDLDFMQTTYPEAWDLLHEMEDAFANESARKHQAWVDAGHPLNGRCKTTLEDGSRCNTKPVHGVDECEGCGGLYDGVRRAPTGMWSADYWGGEGCRDGTQRLIQRNGPNGDLMSMDEWEEYLQGGVLPVESGQARLWAFAPLSVLFDPTLSTLLLTGLVGLIGMVKSSEDYRCFCASKKGRLMTWYDNDPRRYSASKAPFARDEYGYYCQTCGKVGLRKKEVVGSQDKVLKDIAIPIRNLKGLCQQWRTEDDWTIWPKIEAKYRGLTQMQCELVEAFNDVDWPDYDYYDDTIMNGLALCGSPLFDRLLMVARTQDGIIDSSHPAEQYIIAIESAKAIIGSWEEIDSYMAFAEDNHIFHDHCLVDEDGVEGISQQMHMVAPGVALTALLDPTMTTLAIAGLCALVGATVTLDFGKKEVVEAPLWTKGNYYKDRVAEIGEHWTWYFDYRGFSVRVHVPLSLRASDDQDESAFWADARGLANDRFWEIFQCYPDRNDIYSSPSENAENDDLPPGLGTILHYKVNEIQIADKEESFSMVAPGLVLTGLLDPTLTTMALAGLCALVCVAKEEPCPCPTCEQEGHAIENSSEARHGWEICNCVVCEDCGNLYSDGDTTNIPLEVRAENGAPLDGLMMCLDCRERKEEADPTEADLGIDLALRIEAIEEFMNPGVSIHHLECPSGSIITSYNDGVLNPAFMEYEAVLNKAESWDMLMDMRKYSDAEIREKLNALHADMDDESAECGRLAEEHEGEPCTLHGGEGDYCYNAALPVNPDSDRVDVHFDWYSDAVSRAGGTVSRATWDAYVAKADSPGGGRDEFQAVITEAMASEDYEESERDHDNLNPCNLSLDETGEEYQGPFLAVAPGVVLTALFDPTLTTLALGLIGVVGAVVIPNVMDNEMETSRFVRAGPGLRENDWSVLTEKVYEILETGSDDDLPDDVELDLNGRDSYHSRRCTFDIPHPVVKRYFTRVYVVVGSRGITNEDLNNREVNVTLTTMLRDGVEDEAIGRTSLRARAILPTEFLRGLAEVEGDNAQYQEALDSRWTRFENNSRSDRVFSIDKHLDLTVRDEYRYEEWMKTFWELFDNRSQILDRIQMVVTLVDGPNFAPVWGHENSLLWSDEDYKRFKNRTQAVNITNAYAQHFIRAMTLPGLSPHDDMYSRLQGAWTTPWSHGHASIIDGHLKACQNALDRLEEAEAWYDALEAPREALRVIRKYGSTENLVKGKKDEIAKKLHQDLAGYVITIEGNGYSTPNKHMLGHEYEEARPGWIEVSDYMNGNGVLSKVGLERIIDLIDESEEILRNKQGDLEVNLEWLRTACDEAEVSYQYHVLEHLEFPVESLGLLICRLWHDDGGFLAEDSFPDLNDDWWDDRWRSVWGQYNWDRYEEKIIHRSDPIIPQIRDKNDGELEDRFGTIWGGVGHLATGSEQAYTYAEDGNTHFPIPTPDNLRIMVSWSDRDLFSQIRKIIAILPRWGVTLDERGHAVPTYNGVSDTSNLSRAVKALIGAKHPTIGGEGE